MVTFEQAVTAIQEQVFHMPMVAVPLLESLGKYIASPIIAPIDVPGFDNSAMDGFCFAYDATHVTTSYQIKYTIKAGYTLLPVLKPGEAARIFTGAPIPGGADTVVMQEKATVMGEELLIPIQEVTRGENIRLRASQTPKGKEIVPAHTYITAELIGFLAGFGLSHLPVFQTPTIGILCTGNELVDLGQPLAPGKIYNSNAYSLQALLKSIGITNPIVAFANDELPDVQEKAKTLLEKVDVLLVSGGISVGSYDFVYEALRLNHVQPIFYKVKQKPGKPLFFGRKENKLIFAIPGNPAACITCFHVYVKPALKYLLGDKKTYHPTNTFTLAHDYTKKGSLTNFVKAIYKSGSIHILEGQESYKTDAFATSNGIVILPAEKQLFLKEEPLIFIPY